MPSILLVSNLPHFLGSFLQLAILEPQPGLKMDAVPPNPGFPDMDLREVLSSSFNVHGKPHGLLLSFPRWLSIIVFIVLYFTVRVRGRARFVLV